jgi:uncharacterized membrane protein
MRTALPVALLLLLLVALVPSTASAQFQSNSLTVKVYADGSAHITQTLAANSSDVSVEVVLLSPILSDVVAVDHNGSPLSFQISGSNITIYTLGSTGITLQYDTDALTDKQGTTWTLDFTTPYNVTAVLPQSSMVISVSPTPNSFSTQNGSPVVFAPPGTWRISYGVPVSISSSASSTSGQSSSSSVASSLSSSSSSSSSSTAGGPTGNGFPYTYLAAAILVVAAGALGAAFYLRRRGSAVDLNSSDLRPDDIQVLNFIAEKGGKVFEPEIRTRFVLPKTSAWRQVKRLERLGYVKISKVGSQNQIEIVRNREKTGS